MARLNLEGMGVALVTPFRHDKSVDYEALTRLIDHLISEGADYLVVLATTSETPTLFPDEKAKIRSLVKQHAAGRVPLVLGVGGNNTLALVEELRSGVSEGFDAVLSVVPYYNKPSQEGIYQHYRAIAEASPLPLILYNVPGRTGVNMTPATTLRLAHDFPEKIVGIKEASGNLAQIEEIIAGKPENFSVVSGDDAVTIKLMELGAVGVISVIGNAFPHEFGEMVRLCLQGNFEEAHKIHARFEELYSLLFVDGSPAGVKCTLHALGMIENELRLPLVPTRLSTDEQIHEVLEAIRAKK